MSHVSLWMQGKREAVVTVYESKPLISDHKVPGADFQAGHDIA
jgi:hypothetical protein